MPYFITGPDKAEGCAGWATVKQDGEVMGCHQTKQGAIDQMVALSIAEGIEPGGERKDANMTEERQLPDNYRPALEGDVPEGRACGNCAFYDETNTDGDRAWCQRWEEYVRGDYYCNAWQADERAADMGNVEYRNFDAEVTEIRQAENGDGMTFGGYAWKYDSPSLPLGHGFTERIAQGAFTRSLKSRVDIRAYVNHNDEVAAGFDSRQDFAH